MKNDKNLLMKRCSYLLGLLFFFFNSFAVMQAGAMEEMKRDRGDLDPRDAAKENSAVNRIIAGQHQRTPSSPQSGSMTVNAADEDSFSSSLNTLEGDPLKFTSPNVTGRSRERRSSAQDSSHQSSSALTADALEDLLADSMSSDSSILQITGDEFSFINPTQFRNDGHEYDVVLAAVESALKQAHGEASITEGSIKRNLTYATKGLTKKELSQIIQDIKENIKESYDIIQNEQFDNQADRRESGWFSSLNSLFSLTRREDTTAKRLSTTLAASGHFVPSESSLIASMSDQLESKVDVVTQENVVAQEKLRAERLLALSQIEKEHGELQQSVDHHQSILNKDLASIEAEMDNRRYARKVQAVKNLVRGFTAHVAWEQQAEKDLANERRVKIRSAKWKFMEDSYNDESKKMDLFIQRRAAIYEDSDGSLDDLELQEVRKLGRSIISFINTQNNPSCEFLLPAMRVLHALRKVEFFILGQHVSEMKNNAKDQLLKAKEEMALARTKAIESTTDEGYSKISAFFDRNDELLDSANKHFLFAEASRSEALTVATTNINAIKAHITEIKSQIENDQVALEKIKSLDQEKFVSHFIEAKKAACNALEEAIIAYEQLQSETFIQQQCFLSSFPLIKESIAGFRSLLEKQKVVEEKTKQASTIIDAIQKIFPEGEKAEIELQDPQEFLDHILNLSEENDEHEIIGNHGRFGHSSRRAKMPQEDQEKFSGNREKKLSGEELSGEEEAKESNALLRFACCRLLGIDSVKRFDGRFGIPIDSHTLIEVKGLKKFMKDEERYHRSSLFLPSLPQDGIDEPHKHEVMLSHFMEELRRAPEGKIVKWHAPTMAFNPFAETEVPNLSGETAAAIEHRDIEAGIEHAKEAVRKIFTREQLPPAEMAKLLNRYETRLAERARKIEPGTGKITGLSVGALRSFIEAEKRREYGESQNFWNKYNTDGLVESALKGIAYSVGSVGVAIMVPHLPLVVSGMGLGVVAFYIYSRYLSSAAAVAAERL